MENAILKIIRENKESHMSLQEGEIASATEIAETFERFTEWLLRRKIERIGLATEEYKDIKEAFIYWNTNFNK